MGLLKLEARLWALLKTCTRRQLSQLHGLLLTSSLHRLPGLPALLVRHATDAGDMAHADLLFSSSLPHAPPDGALFNSMIRACSYHGPHERALDLFEEMLRRGLATGGFTYPYVLDAAPDTAPVRRAAPLPRGSTTSRPSRPRCSPSTYLAAPARCGGCTTDCASRRRHSQTPANPPRLFLSHPHRLLRQRKLQQRRPARPSHPPPPPHASVTPRAPGTTKEAPDSGRSTTTGSRAGLVS